MTGLKTNTFCTATSTESKALSFDVPFVELLARSNFSFLQGASHPEEMALQAQALGYKGLALCDLNGLYGVVRAWQAIAYPSNFTAPRPQETSDFQFHSGAEMQLTNQTSIALLPLNKQGYTQLCQLITLSKRPVPKGYVALSLFDLARHGEDLIGLPLPPWNEDTLHQLMDIFKDRLYLPVWKDYTWESLEIYNQALQIEKSLHVPIVATNRPFMHARERKPLHDVLTCIFHQTTLQKAKTRLTSNSERHLKSLAELKELWSDRPDALYRTHEISQRIHFSLTELRYEYPQSHVPEGKTSSQYLRESVQRGLQKRYPDGIPTDVQKTTDHELTLIQELEYEDYFLTLWEICQFAQQSGILYQGRGSAANSIVCYSLELTAVDPTKVHLLFERFISKERGEPPDIDIDFQNDRREEIIQHIYEKYGASHAAMVCTVICYRSRMALRECAKVLDIPLKTINQMIKFMGKDGLSRLQDNLQMAPIWGLIPEKLQRLLQIASAMKGFPRHLGIHSGGFLIARRPITEWVPVEKATMDKRFVIQWNKDDLTVLKMLKIDVLSLGMLAALQKSFDLLREHKKLDWDLATLSKEDSPTYEMIQKADTIGVFQIESRAQMSLLPRLKPKCFYDLVVEVAIVRPGPIQGGMVHPYIRRRQGLEPITYAHKDLVPILEKTFGIPIFQEQIMQIASSVAGFSPGEADELRRIMSSSWKKTDLMKGLRERLLNGMIQHGIPLAYAERIYQTIVGFSSYGFPESHAASFALLTYASCYIKHHHPDIFAAALLNSQPMGFYLPRALIADAQRHGVRFLDVDLQKSDWDYTLESDPASDLWRVRSGFRSIAGLPHDAVLHFLEERKAHGPFHDLADLVQRTRLKKKSLLLLGSSGALKCLGLSPRQALWRIQSLTLDSQSLFWGQSDSQDQKQIPKETEWEAVSREYRSQGYSLHSHPIQLLRKQLDKRYSWSKAGELAQLRNGQWVHMAGLVSLLQRPPTAKGFVFLTVEDETGVFNAIILPKVYEKYRLLLHSQSLLQFEGRLQKQEDVIHLKVARIKTLQAEAVSLAGRHPD